MFLVVSQLQTQWSQSLSVKSKAEKALTWDEPEKSSISKNECTQSKGIFFWSGLNWILDMIFEVNSEAKRKQFQSRSGTKMTILCHAERSYWSCIEYMKFLSYLHHFIVRVIWILSFWAYFNKFNLESEEPTHLQIFKTMDYNIILWW